jgi:hypothetical protein
LWNSATSRNDVLARRGDALKALEVPLEDEPAWFGKLFVAPIDLDDRDVSAN